LHVPGASPLWPFPVGGILERKADRTGSADLLCPTGNTSGAHEVRALCAAGSQLHAVVRPGWWVRTAAGDSVKLNSDCASTT